MNLKTFSFILFNFNNIIESVSGWILRSHVKSNGVSQNAFNAFGFNLNLIIILCASQNILTFRILF